MGRRKSRRSRQRQSFTEITIALPILLLVFTGMVEIAWWLHSYVTVATAAREGARYGSRGLHLPTSDIADVTRVALEGSLDVAFTGPEANASILVTEIDFEPDGSYTINDSRKLGSLAVESAICLHDPCNPGQIDLSAFRDGNVFFNASPMMCNDADGCRNDVVVEVFFRHDPILGTLFTEGFMPRGIPVDSLSVMRILFLRNPS